MNPLQPEIDQIKKTKYSVSRFRKTVREKHEAGMMFDIASCSWVKAKPQKDMMKANIV